MTRVCPALGTYEIKYASGQKWYGEKDLFGEDTACTKADTTFDFRKFGNQISGYTITLYKVIDGNMSSTPISPKDF